MFNGSFEEVLRVNLLRAEFETYFVAPLTKISRDALYVALGRTPFDALLHCIERGVIKEHQVLGALAHPSGSGGSQVAVYLGEKSADDLHPADPVRARAAWLRSAYVRMRTSTDRLHASAARSRRTKPGAPMHSRHFRLRSTSPTPTDFANAQPSACDSSKQPKR
jgi:hypothetical protein